MAEEVSTLMKATVLMRQPGRVQEIVGALRKGGGDRLQVISDFDMTLSRFAYNGKRCPSSYNILDNSKIISEECRKEVGCSCPLFRNGCHLLLQMVPDWNQRFQYRDLRKLIFKNLLFC
ncbi:7-methylguanosine phosphate-specific 5'-nucleotidase [Hylobates moloch]|uniref:7-methylguanosine phosphate-specific 5'-nucleotidase n=1 Tax=Hylobates moloch TaxID=81572 RepID=UPI00267711D3|nr:7-methylguanosine phosphate-specific 5'-nucleotidase [Hylobates moloch]XP_058301015.1 7-methylguanosine phosphate-specific 5'-nucleotidase [Hylobates moloch]XP_058301016.1 7-methylguanosine phosphate-specific 5'-nucleotidase [Hylobates moloch]XP_058301017.1 7-methylguanosine phosphate-specific 5'-nucleotidase [Hylobates moloch]